MKGDEERDKSVVCGRQACSELGNEGGRTPREKRRKLDTFPSQRCDLVYFRTRLHVGITPNEQISRDLHHRLSELCLLECAGHAELLLDWKSF